MLSRVPCWTNPFWSYHPDTDPVAAQNWKQSLLSDEHFVFFRIRFFSLLVSSIFCWVSLVWASDLNSIFLLLLLLSKARLSNDFCTVSLFCLSQTSWKQGFQIAIKTTLASFLLVEKNATYLELNEARYQFKCHLTARVCFLAREEMDSMKCTLKYFTNTFKLSRYDLYVFFGNWVCFSVSAPSCKYLLGTEVPETFFGFGLGCSFSGIGFFSFRHFFLFCCSTWVAMRRWSQKRAGNVRNLVNIDQNVECFIRMLLLFNSKWFIFERRGDYFHALSLTNILSLRIHGPFVETSFTLGNTKFKRHSAESECMSLFLKSIGDQQ